MNDTKIELPTPTVARPEEEVARPMSWTIQKQLQSKLMVRSAVVYGFVLAILFQKPLLDLLRYSMGSDLYSHLPMIPFISGYLIWLKRKALVSNSPSLNAFGLIPLLLGLVTIGFYLVPVWTGQTFSPTNYLSITTFAFVSLLVGGVGLFLGMPNMRTLAFPMLFLVFTAPFPEGFMNWIEAFLQHASAYVAGLFLSVSGTPFSQNGVVIDLPGITITVAKECSGIHSTLVLALTSLVAAYLFLQSPWKRSALAFAVIPLAILRNGFRIFTISMLCVHVDTEMIDSPLHHRGGPVFFALSLIPLFLFLIILRRSERKQQRVP